MNVIVIHEVGFWGALPADEHFIICQFVVLLQMAFEREEILWEYALLTEYLLDVLLLPSTD
jgi:hypothetical protein